MDAALIKQCADPALKIEIVERFLASAGSADNLKITVRAGDRVILVPKPKNPDEAMNLIRQFAGKADVRVGITQYPAGLGISDPAKLNTDLLDTCKNIRTGTALFSKVYRIVTNWYGTPRQEAFVDAVAAYQSGWFEDKKVFYEPDPGAVKVATPESTKQDEVQPASAEKKEAAVVAPASVQSDDPRKADIRIDLSGVKEFNAERAPSDR